MTITLTTNEVMDLLSRAVDEKGPDYVYEKVDGSFCQYFKGDEPSCIVGHVLAYKGMTAEDMDLAGYNYSSAGTLITYGFVKCDGTMTEDILISAQGFQDKGVSWGDTLASVKRIFFPAQEV